MLKIGLVQLSVREGDIEANKKHIQELVAEHSDGDTDLLCFPELVVSGYDYEKAAASDQEEKFFSSLASTYDTAILAGIHIAEGEAHYDTACLWEKDGSLVGMYRKIHLWDTEDTFFREGDSLITVPFRGWNIGMLICADLGFAEISTPLALKEGADLIIYPSAWGAGFEELYTTCARLRAAENQVFTIAINRACGNMNYCGHSTVSNPDGTILARLTTVNEAYEKVSLDREKLEDARKNIPWRQMKRYELYKTF